jgi:hypothetical protein
MAKLTRHRIGERTTHKVVARGELALARDDHTISLVVTDEEDSKTSYSVKIVTSELVTMLKQLKLIGHN